MINDVLLSDILNSHEIVQIYTGDENGCRCGCHGNYFKAPSKGFSRARNKALKLNPIVQIASELPETHKLILEQYGEEYNGKVRAVGDFYSKPDSDGVAGWIDISLGNGKTITLYVK